MESLHLSVGAVMPFLPYVAGLVAAGLAAGFIAGLFGVGGGTVTVPILFYWFSHMGVSQDVAMHSAVGTSLATIVATSYASSQAHEKNGSVDHALLKEWSPAIAVGSIVGAILAGAFSGSMLRGIFGGFLLMIACSLLFAKEGKALFKNLPQGWLAQAVPGGIGVFSSLVGVGGGALNVPYLTMCNVPIQRAVGTSSAIGIIIALPGAIGFIVSGLGQKILPPFSLGYVCLAALTILLPTTAFMAPYGAKLAHRLSRPLLRRIFAIFLAFISAKMLWGVLNP